jgi:hypothetical protein
MAYTINKFNGEQLIVLDDGTVDTSTSLGLVGRNYVGYGEIQNENFIYLLENFANDAPPSRPLKGQIWFNTTNNLAYVYDGNKWSVVGSAVVSDTPPASPNAGTLWLKTPVNTLNVWNGIAWSFIGPEAVPGFGTTRARSGSLLDINNSTRPVIFLEINSVIIAVCTNSAFTINPSNSIPNLNNNLIAGINLTTNFKINGDITGNSTSTDRLLTPRTINGVPFDGQQNINIKSSTANKLVRGSYLTGSDFDGTNETVWSVDASPSNIIGKVVARNSEGGFAAGTINATFIGNLSGNVSSAGTSDFNIVRANQFIGATLTGNAFSASQLEVPRRINGVLFDATADIIVTSDAGTLTGNTLNSTVTISNLNRVGTLAELSIIDAGATIGTGGQLKLLVDSGVPTVRSSTGQLNFDIGASGPDISFVNSSQSVLLGGPNAPAVIGDNTTNLGINGHKFNNVYANNFLGNATSATTAITSTNIAGGGLGSIPVQTLANTTSFINPGADGYVLRSRPNGPNWEALSFEQLNSGTYLTFVDSITSAIVSSFNSTSPVTISVDATPTNTASKIVVRDNSGNFSAGTITANLTGNVSGNAATASKLQTSRTINGVAFDGTENITISAADTTKVSKSGDSMTGFLTLNANPTNALHAAPKQYVDSRLPQYTIISGSSASTVGFTNQVGSWNFNSNYFDVFPPAPKTMANLVAFIPSINQIHFAGGVNGDDSMVCTYSYLADRIRVYVQNTEQRSTPAANYLVIWS